MSGWAIRKSHGITFAEAGSGPVMVMCHGGAGSHTHWARNIDALAAHFTVRALDLPGYGDSDPTNKDFTAEEHVAAATPKVDGLTADVERFHLVGFSFGGALSAGIAATLGERVEKLTLVAPGGFGDPISHKSPLGGLFRFAPCVARHLGASPVIHPLYHYILAFCVCR